MLSSPLLFALSTVHFPRGFCTKILYKFLVSHILSKCAAYCSLLNLILIIVCDVYDHQSSSLCNFLHFSLHPYFVHLFSWTLFLNTCTLWSSFKVEVHIHMKNCKIIFVLYVLMFILLESRWG
jgi:hypothetical protein